MHIKNGSGFHKLFSTVALSVLMIAVVVPSSACRQENSPEASNSEPSPTTVTDEQASRLALEDTPEELLSFKEWHKVNPEPIKMPPEVSVRCVGPSKEELEALNIAEHGNKYFTVFINDIGRERLLNWSEDSFPVGTIVVKQKHEGPNPESSELYTAMVKREPGYASEIGDWEFFVLDGTAKKVEVRGQPENCVSCHIERESNDYVFANYTR